MDRDPHLGITLAGRPESVRLARRAVRILLDGFAPAETIADAQLVVSELATNALEHGAPTFELLAWLWERRCRLEVRDAGQTTATPNGAAPHSGNWDKADVRLAIVAALTAEMGHAREEDGTVMTAELRWDAW